MPFREEQRAIAATRGEAGIEADHQTRFWLGLIYAGIAAYGTVCLGILLYLAHTPERPNRLAISGVLLLALSFTFGFFRLRHWLLEHPKREALFALWNAVSYPLLALVTILDGGIGSPVANLFILPILFVAIGFPLRFVVVSGGFGLANYVLAIVATPGMAPDANVALQAAAVAIGLLLGILGAVFRDRKERELARLRERLAVVATTDGLTGCHNQRAFMAVLHGEIARSARYRRPIALILLDVDRFKTINDSRGHQCGDDILRRVGAVLRDMAREPDCVARQGGDEFALLAPELDAADALAMAQRLRDDIGKKMATVKVTVSIGVYAAVPGLDDVDVFMERADRALYEAKRLGRDQVALWHQHCMGTAGQPRAGVEPVSR